MTILGGAGCGGAFGTDRSGRHSPGSNSSCYEGKEFIEYENPYDVGMTGLLGFSSGYYAIMNSDLLLMLGTDFLYPPAILSSSYTLFR